MSVSDSRYLTVDAISPVASHFCKCNLHSRPEVFKEVTYLRAAFVSEIFISPSLLCFLQPSILSGTRYIPYTDSFIFPQIFSHQSLVLFPLFLTNILLDYIFMTTISKFVKEEKVQTRLKLVLKRYPPFDDISTVAGYLPVPPPAHPTPTQRQLVFFSLAIHLSTLQTNLHCLLSRFKIRRSCPYFLCLSALPRVVAPGATAISHRYTAFAF